LKAEILRMEVEGQKLGHDYEAKKLEFQKELMEMNKKQAVVGNVAGPTT
jgi:hypothetical protein